MNIPLSCPDITQAERDAVNEVMCGTQLSLGPKLLEFERVMADFAGTRHAIAVNSGTSGLHLCLKAMGIGPGDEVVTTPFSFIASANCILFDGGKPVFVDIDPETWNLDPARLPGAITPRTRAILAVDVFGLPADFDAIRQTAIRHNLRVVEDSCEALGATYKGRNAGALGEVGVFGFYPNKQVTTGEGGVVVTDNEEIAKLIASYRSQGRDTHGGGWLSHVRLGYNFRLSEINCALGLAQMRRIEEILANRRRVAGWYLERLADNARIRIQRIPADARISWFVMVVRLEDRYMRADRDRILERLKGEGIGCSNYFPAIHLQPFYRQMGYREGDFPLCEALADRTIALPFHGRLSEPEVDTACKTLDRLL